jgi:cytochrome c-type biogenesis protein CcmF
MLGSIIIKIAFIACLASVYYYYQAHRTGRERFASIGRALFHVTIVSVMVSSAIHLYNILTHDFRYSYVWSYSSVELSTPLLISTFYAGQEGSFLLWTLFTALIAIFLMRYTMRMGYEPQVMTAYGLIQLSLLLMLLVKSPFAFIWETWPGEVDAGAMPINGRGLNPLLQNYWMVIHPQVLFSGFAAMGVPYAFAIAAMMKRDYTNWIRPATPWLVYGAMVLGLGIMMGGFWAYETLGWGGYWGWDPVENSSLVPWLFSVATIHTMLSQRKSGVYLRTNLALSMLCFIFVLYSTFLTRSGVLGDTSVHSFVDPGMWAYWLLIGILALFTIGGFGLLLTRMREMPKPAVKHHYMSREFALFLGSAALASSAIFITVGTSSPIITGILQGKVTAVDISYYVTTNLPLGIAIGLLSGIGQLLWWNRSNQRELLWSTLRPAVVALAATIALVFFGLDDILVGLFVFGAAFSLMANLEVGRRIVKGNPKYAGGAIAHVGLAMMFLGFVSSSVYDQKETVSLYQGRSTNVLGYNLTYTGYSPIDAEKFAFHVDVERNGSRRVVSPIMYHSEFTQGLMRNPDVMNLITRDFYVAPLSLEQPENAGASSTQQLELRKGQTARLGELTFTFLDFDFPVMEKAAMLEGREVRIGALLEVAPEGEKPVRLTPYKVLGGGSTKDLPASFGERYEVSIAGMTPDRDNSENSTVRLAVLDKGKAGSPEDTPDVDILVVEASIKPYINLVWNGVIVIIVGFIVTIVRRSQEARLKRTDPA